MKRKKITNDIPEYAERLLLKGYKAKEKYMTKTKQQDWIEQFIHNYHCRYCGEDGYKCKWDIEEAEKELRERVTSERTKAVEDGILQGHFEASEDREWYLKEQKKKLLKELNKKIKKMTQKISKDVMIRGNEAQIMYYNQALSEVQKLIRQH